MNDATHDTQHNARGDAADRINTAADALDRDADRTDLPATVADRKRAAAADLRAYGERVRAGDQPYDAAGVEMLADAGNGSGIVMDDWRSVETQLQQPDAWVPQDAKRQLREDYERRRATLDKLVADGHMVRVDEDGQAPFYALASYGGWTRDETAARDAADVDEPAP